MYRLLKKFDTFFFRFLYLDYEEYILAHKMS
jgi:hypothetical protein